MNCILRLNCSPLHTLDGGAPDDGAQLVDGAGSDGGSLLGTGSAIALERIIGIRSVKTYSRRDFFLPAFSSR